MRDKCPICDKELHSIITRRVGEIAVCIDCGDKLIPLVDAFAFDLVTKAGMAVRIGVLLDKNLVERFMEDFTDLSPEDKQLVLDKIS